MIKPMTAHKYALHKMSFPCFVQPKLNGVRGVYIPVQVPHFQSRYGEIWSPSVVAHALSALTKQQFHLDGEFYRHGMSLQAINSRIGVVRNGPHAESTMIQFNVFDVMIDVPFYKRLKIMEKLAAMLEGETGVEFVKTCEVTSQIEADYLYNQWKKNDNYEGMMYRDPDSTYGFAYRCGNKDNRWNYLLKRKEMMDFIATVIGLKEMISGETGEGKGTLGAFELRAPNGAVFTAGSGLNDKDRAKYWALGEDRMAGTQVHINFEMLSDSGTPLKPIVDLVDYRG